MYKDDVVEKKSWVRVLKSDAQRSRRRREKEYGDVSLDEILDRRYENNRW
jgi:hypothetical protein